MLRLPKIFKHPHRSWPKKLAIAALSIVRGIRGQSSFYVHLFFAVAAVVAGVTLGISRLEWGLLVLCITVVLATEMVNRSIELLARAVTQYENRWVRDALDVASAAVMITAIGAVVIGLLIFVPHLVELFVG